MFGKANLNIFVSNLKKISVLNVDADWSKMGKQQIQILWILGTSFLHKKINSFAYDGNEYNGLNLENSFI